MKLTNGQVQSKKREAASLLRLEMAAEGVGTTVFFVVGLARALAALGYLLIQH